MSKWDIFHAIKLVKIGWGKIMDYDPKLFFLLSRKSEVGLELRLDGRVGWVGVGCKMELCVEKRGIGNGGFGVDFKS